MSVKKYVKFDSEKGYIDNKDDINYFAINQMRKVAFGKMLGDFDENGLYVVNQKIVDELIKMPKVIVEVLEEADLIRSKVKADSFFHFILTIEDNKATLKLLEKIHYQSNRDFNSGVYSNINEYVLDEVIIPDKDFDRNALYEKYNISVDNDGEVLSIFDMDELSLALYYNIIEKLKINYLVQNELILKEKQLENIEADYFESILTVLNEYKEFGDKVTTSVKKDLAEKHSFVIVSKPFFQQTVNEVVDSYIDLYIQELSFEQREEILNKIRTIKENYYQRFKTLIPIQIANKAGVRFDPNQIVQEGFIGGLAREISSKGFTSSDIRKILINEGELQLSIAKIKEMVLENEEICKRDNAKAKDIVKNRTLTTKFYNELEKENEVDILKPDTTLIKSVIDNKKEEKVEKVENKPKQEVAKKTESAKNPQANKIKGSTKKATASSSKGKGGGGGSSKPKKQEVKKDNKQANNSASTKKEQLFIYNSSVGSSSKNEQNAIKSQRVRESAVGNLDNKNQTFTDQRDVADELEL
ncbi:MAG: hypothetical protein IJ458_00290 [Clostridia bacterium]|nr:hypothetical protein [Clostridia bacterium]